MAKVAESEGRMRQQVGRKVSVELQIRWLLDIWTVLDIKVKCTLIHRKPQKHQGHGWHGWVWRSNVCREGTPALSRAGVVSIYQSTLFRFPHYGNSNRRWGSPRYIICLPAGEVLPAEKVCLAGRGAHSS